MKIYNESSFTGILVINIRRVIYKSFAPNKWDPQSR